MILKLPTQTSFQNQNFKHNIIPRHFHSYIWKNESREMFKVFVINDFLSMRSLKPPQSYHMIVCDLRCFSHYPAWWSVYSTKCKHCMFSTKAAMNHFHTLPESPQVLIIHLNQFGVADSETFPNWQITDSFHTHLYGPMWGHHPI